MKEISTNKHIRHNLRKATRTEQTEDRNPQGEQNLALGPPEMAETNRDKHSHEEKNGIIQIKNSNLSVQCMSLA